MGSEQKASLDGTITWASGESFTGWFLLGLVPSLRGGTTAYTTFYKRYGTRKVRIPQWLTIPIQAGEFQESTKVRYNSSIEPLNTRYVGFFIDYEGNIIATQSLFTVATDPHTITEPSMTIPTAGSTAPTPCQGVSVSALSTPIVEVPAGTIDGVNDTFTLSVVPPSTLMLYKSGQLMTPGTAYTLTGTTIVFEADYIPQTTNDLLAFIF